MKSGLKLLLVLLLLLPPQLQGATTEYVFLVTGDGIRTQDLFTGVDPLLMGADNKKASGIEDVRSFEKEFWDQDPLLRRQKVMPFFWTELSKQGIIFGNRDLGSACTVQNPHHFSYPGYAEILNGQPLMEIASNDAVFSPRETVLEYVRREFNLKREQVACFGSWSIFNWIVMKTEGAVFCNSGYKAMPASLLLTERMKFWNDLQFETLSPWNTVRHDSVTLGLALEYIKTQQPKFLYLALGETDDWAHNRRYDRTIQTLKFFDEALRRLWTLLQSTEPYRGKSTLIVTTDHGRGRTPTNWTDHGKNVPGADEVWIAVFGPDTPHKGEAQESETYSLSNVTPTILTFFGLDPKKFNPNSAPPIREALNF